MKNSDYVLVTPARNEEAVIENTLKSVVSQKHLPQKWVIISDGSTDNTDAIVSAWAKQHKFIEFMRSQETGTKRSFDSKARAFILAHSKLNGISYQYIGNLDADVSFADDYFKKLLQYFDRNRQIGLAGGLICELLGDDFVPQRISGNSVAGAVQMFRRECYESIGGYIPLRFGGIDAAAEIMTRMKGWRVETVRDLPVRHHRPVASGEGKILRTKWRHGFRHYCLGYHPLFELMRNAYGILDRPLILGSCITTMGYAWASFRKPEREISLDVVKYLRREQIQRLRNGLRMGL